jgi:hypothetical protein
VLYPVVWSKAARQAVRRALDYLEAVAERAARCKLDGLEIEDGKLFIVRPPPAVPR